MNLWVVDRPGREKLGPLPPGVDLHLLPDEGDLPAVLAEAEFLVPSGDRTLIERLPGMSALRVIQTLSAGVDWLAPHVPAGVTLCDAAGSRDIAVAEWALAALLATVRTLGELRDQQRAHHWAFVEPGELAGSTVLILGYGSIGRALEARLIPFGVEVIRVARRPRAEVHGVGELAGLLPRADHLVVLLPLTDDTRGLLDRELIGLLGDGATVINAARGAVIDNAALRERLRSGTLRAVLDVTDPEPLPADDVLWDLPGVLITPHLAGDTAAAERRAFAFAGAQIRRFVAGEELLNVVADGY